jgi:hypothetical protein
MEKPRRELTQGVNLSRGAEIIFTLWRVSVSLSKIIEERAESAWRRFGARFLHEWTGYPEQTPWALRQFGEP